MSQDQPVLLDIYHYLCRSYRKLQTSFFDAQKIFVRNPFKTILFLFKTFKVVWNWVKIGGSTSCQTTGLNGFRTWVPRSIWIWKTWREKNLVEFLFFCIKILIKFNQFNFSFHLCLLPFRFIFKTYLRQFFTSKVPVLVVVILLVFLHLAVVLHLVVVISLPIPVTHV